jgi:MOSC domain-containing protein YiiM
MPGTVESLNVGAPRAVQVNGHAVLTAIWKSPVEGKLARPLGSTLLEVAQPRLPCFKLGLRMGDPRFPKRFAPPPGPARTCASWGRATSAPATRSG